MLRALTTTATDTKVFEIQRIVTKDGHDGQCKGKQGVAELHGARDPGAGRNCENRVLRVAKISVKFVKLIL